MLRELPIINTHRKKRKIGLYPEQIIFIEQMSKKKCTIVVLVAGTRFVYIVPKSYDELMSFKNLSAFGVLPN